MYLYIFGEKDGRFSCQHEGCPNDTFSIFTKEEVEITEALHSGAALCSEHEPDNYKSATGCMASLLHMISNKEKPNGT